MALNLKAPKQITKLWKSYIESLKSGGHKSTKMEALRPFMGARGGILKRNTRSAKQKEAFNAAAQEVQKQYGRKTSQRAFTEKQEKQRATRAINAAKEYQKKQKKKQTGKALTRGAKKYVEEQQRKYDEMLDILTSGSQKLLSSKVRYEIYKAMDAENISAEDIQAFIDKLLATLGDIPEEAAELVQWNCANIDKTYEGIKTRDLGTIFEAFANQPLCENLTVEEAKELFKEMCLNTREYLDEFYDLDGYFA